MELNDNKVIFRAEDHTYWLNGKQLFGITGMLGRQLFPDKYKGVSDATLANAAKRGNDIHNECFQFDMFGTVKSEEVRWYKDLKEKEQFKVIDSEYIVTDKEYFATAIDKVLKFKDCNKNEVDLGDIKTTYSLDEEYLSWQLSINKHLFELNNPKIKVRNLYGIWIRNGVAKSVKVNEQPQNEVIRLLECEKNGEQFIPQKQVPEKYESKALVLMRDLADIAEQIKYLEGSKKEYQSRIEKLFTQFNITKWETDYFTITKKKDYEKETFDSKRFKEENPELYKEFINKTAVKGGIITKLKDYND